MDEQPHQPFPIGHGSVILPTQQGRDITIRHMQPDDSARLVAFFHQLSPETRRRRFMASLIHPPEEVVQREAARFANIDPAQQAALVGVVGTAGEEQIVGAARLAHTADPTEAEMAIVIRDDYQHEGLGTLLLDLLVQVALVRGVQHIHALSLADNEGIRRLIAKLGFSYTQQTLHGETVTVIALAS